MMGNDNSGWRMENNHCDQRPGGRSDGVWLSDITPGGRLAIPDTISDAEQATRLLPRRYATEYFVYRKDKYWHGDDTVNYTVSRNSDLQCSFPWLSSFVSI